MTETDILLYQGRADALTRSGFSTEAGSFFERDISVVSTKFFRIGEEFYYFPFPDPNTYVFLPSHALLVPEGYNEKIARLREEDPVQLDAGHFTIRCSLQTSEWELQLTNSSSDLSLPVRRVRIEARNQSVERLRELDPDSKIESS